MCISRWFSLSLSLTHKSSYRLTSTVIYDTQEFEVWALYSKLTVITNTGVHQIK